MRQEQEFRDERAKARNGGFAGDPLQSANVRRLWQNPRIEAMLLPFTLQSTQAHLRMLGDCSLIDPDIATGLASAVGDLRKRVHEGENILDRNDEDVLSAVERHLSETFGVNAGAVRLFSSRTAFRGYSAMDARYSLNNCSQHRTAASHALESCRSAR
jgi:argininosuccinate lyase